MELDFEVVGEKHTLSVVAHEGRTEIVFDNNATPILCRLQDIVKYHQEHGTTATLLYADEETKAFLAVLSKVFQHLGCKTELRKLWELNEYNLEETYQGYVVATYGAPNRTDDEHLTQLQGQIMWAHNVRTDCDPVTLTEFYREGFRPFSTHKLVVGITNAINVINYKLFGEDE